MPIVKGLTKKFFWLRIKGFYKEKIHVLSIVKGLTKKKKIEVLPTIKDLTKMYDKSFTKS